MSLAHCVTDQKFTPVTPFNVEFKTVTLATPDGKYIATAAPYVVGAGSRFKTIQSAIDQAAADLPNFATILVEPQAYTENITVPGSLPFISICGLGFANIIGSITVNGSASSTCVIRDLIVTPPNGTACLISNGGLVVVANTFLTPEAAPAVEVLAVVPGQGASVALLCAAVFGTPTYGMRVLAGTVVHLGGIMSSYTTAAYYARDATVIANAATCFGNGGALADIDNSFVSITGMFSFNTGPILIATGSLSLRYSSIDSGGAPLSRQRAHATWILFNRR